MSDLLEANLYSLVASEVPIGFSLFTFGSVEEVSNFDFVVDSCVLSIFTFSLTTFVM